MSLGLFRKTLRRLQRHFDDLAARGCIELTLVEQPILDLEEPRREPSLPKGIWGCDWGEVVYRAPSIAVKNKAYFDLTACTGFAHPPFDAEGMLLVDNEGQLVGIDCGVVRTLSLTWEASPDLESSFSALAEAAGVVLKDLPVQVLKRFPADTLKTSHPALLWGFAIFDLAQARVPGSPLRAGLHVDLPERHSSKSTLELPCWWWVLDDASRASGFAIDIILHDLSTCEKLVKNESTAAAPATEVAPSLDEAEIATSAGLPATDELHTLTVYVRL